MYCAAARRSFGLQGQEGKGTQQANALLTPIFLAGSVRLLVWERAGFESDFATAC